MALTLPEEFSEPAPELLVLDVDGVLTDNCITIDADGRESKVFFVPDGAGIRNVARLGIATCVMSGRRSSSTEHRAHELAIDHCFTGVEDKLSCLERLLGDLGIDAARTCYVGDDVIDVGPMAVVGIPIAVANAQAATMRAARFVTVKQGGDGAVREVCDWIANLIESQQREDGCV